MSLLVVCLAAGYCWCRYWLLSVWLLVVAEAVGVLDVVGVVGVVGVVVGCVVVDAVGH